MIDRYDLEKARKHDNNWLKNCIWEAANGQPIPGLLSIEALRAVLIERGEDGKGYHNT